MQLLCNLLRDLCIGGSRLSTKILHVSLGFTPTDPLSDVFNFFDRCAATLPKFYTSFMIHNLSVKFIGSDSFFKMPHSLSSSGS